MKKFGIEEYDEIRINFSPVKGSHPFEDLSKLNSGITDKNICSLPIYSKVFTGADIWLKSQQENITIEFNEKVAKFQEMIDDQFPNRISVQVKVLRSDRLERWKVIVEAGFLFVDDFDEFQVLARLKELW